MMPIAFATNLKFVKKTVSAKHKKRRMLIPGFIFYFFYHFLS